MSGYPLNIPDIPAAHGFESTGRAHLVPRYEDVTQDGRVHLHSLMTGLTAVWRSLAESHHMRSFRERGILPILSRIIMLGDDEGGPFSAHVPLEVEGTWRLAKERGGERLFLDMWLEARAPNATTLGPPPPSDAPRARVGRVYAEHVITRPFAKTASERKVTRLEVPGLPAVPEHEHAYEEATALVASALPDQQDEELRRVTFGFLHTDPNQHVNSLVYPRLFEEAVAARAIEGRLTPNATHLLARGIELRYRKPFFTGDHATIRARLEPTGGASPGLRAVGAFVPIRETGTETPTKPSTAIEMTFR